MKKHILGLATLTSMLDNGGDPRMFRGVTPQKGTVEGRVRGERLAGAEARDPLERQPFITDCPEVQGVLKFWKWNNMSLKPWLYSRTWQIL